MSLEDLREELNIVAKHSKHGSHKTVSDMCNISTSYLWQIKSGIAKNIDGVEAREFIHKLINAYRKIARDEERKILEFEKQNQ